MRYLRMLSNAMIAGGLASGYLIALVLQLNPSFAIDPGTLAPLALVLGLAYGANLTVVFYALIVMRQILEVEVLSPGWLSVRLLSWLCTIAAGGGAAIMWLNLRGFGPVLDQATAGRMVIGASIISAAAVIFLLIGLAHLGRRGGRTSATILVTTMVLSVIGPIAARGPGQQPLPARAIAAPADVAARADAHVTMLMLDGATLDVISPAVAAGRLPNFGRIFDQGAVLHLATLRPTQAEPVWSAIATGRLPIDNGIRSAVVYRVLGGAAIQLLPDYCFAQLLASVGFLTEQPQTSNDLAAKPIWKILSDQNVPVGVIGWPLSHPASAINGFLVSEAFHRLSETEINFEGPIAVSPPELLADARAALLTPAEPDPVALVSTMGAPPPVNDYDTRRDRTQVVADRVHLQLLNALEGRAPSFLAARFPGIDAVGHLFLRFADPSAFGDVSEDEREKFGRVLDQYYGFVDMLVGREMERLGPNDLLLVVSAFGMEPLSPGKRVLERIAGNPQISGTHERAPDGFVLAFGPPVEPRALAAAARASVVDVAPTLLYFLGLPVGRDMDGFARTDLFKPAFTSDKPVTYIPSYGR
ncbi:MAG: alkaline phosphatase family protein [Vicinamibacterales bacterium]|nr:alkaline phosphatase family protein [Vicinamibacterales bacterium]